MTTFNNRMTGEQSSFVPATETVEEWKARYLKELDEKKAEASDLADQVLKEILETVEVNKESLVDALCNQFFSYFHDEWDTDDWDSNVQEERERLEQYTLKQLIELVDLEDDPDYGPTTVEEFIATWI